MKLGEYWRRSVTFLKQDSWQSWVVSLLLMFVAVKFVFFPVISLFLGTSLPLVVVESCSMYHESSFDEWWLQNAPWYEDHRIKDYHFKEYPFKNGISKGDVIIVSGRGNYSEGDVLIFNSEYQYPIIHRIVTTDPLGTKGDHNGDQLAAEVDINSSQIIGKAVVRIPALGWLKLIFFELLRSPNERGFCK